MCLYSFLLTFVLYSLNDTLVSRLEERNINVYDVWDLTGFIQKPVCRNYFSRVEENW